MVYTCRLKVTHEWQCLLADEACPTTISHQDGRSRVRYGTPIYYTGMYILYIGTALVFPQERLSSRHGS